MSNESPKASSSESPTYKGQFLWNDPFKEDVAGVLLSDKIASYADKCCLVVPFESKLLRPAEYTLRVGQKCYYDGTPSKVEEDKPVVIPPNGLVYIQIYEYFNMPYYLVARYSLRVHQVYRGLILDNGLQVDPGFHGRINVPVYNFTNEEKTLEFKESLLSVEFVKTTPFAPNPPIDSDEEREWVSRDLLNKEEKPLVVFQGEPDKLYQQKTISGYFQDDEKNESSVQKLADNVKVFTKKVKRAEAWGLGGAIAIIIALMGYIYQTQNSVSQARPKTSEVF